MEHTRILKAISQEIQKLGNQYPTLNDKSLEARVAHETYEYLGSAHSYLFHRLVKETFNVECASFAIDKWPEVSNMVNDERGVESDHSVEPKGLAVWVDGEKFYFPCYTGEDCRVLGFWDWHKTVNF